MSTRFWFSLIPMLTSGLVGPVEAAPPPERLLPDATRAVVAAPNAANALRAWKNSQYHTFVNQPLLKPFQDDLARQIERRADLAGIICACWNELAALAT